MAKKISKKARGHCTVKKDPEVVEPDAQELAKDNECVTFSEVFEVCKPLLEGLAMAADGADRWQLRGDFDPKTRVYARRALDTGMMIIADLEKPAQERQTIEWYIGRVMWFDKQVMYAIDKLMGMGHSIAAAEREAARQKLAAEGRCILKKRDDEEKALEIVLRFYKPPRVKKTAACLRAVPVVLKELNIKVGDRTLLRLLNKHLQAD